MIKNLINKITKKLFQDYFDKKLILEAIKISSSNLKKNKIKNFSDIEFQVFSQWGEDGIIDWLIHKIDNLPQIFLEIGTQDYLESNTRYLLQNKNWDGYLIEASTKDVKKIKKQRFFWKHNLKVSNTFINSENINETIKKMKIPKKIGLLSIDVDSIDYWILRKMSETLPGIIVCEFNPLFGTKKAITVPNKKNFVRNKEHFSNLYFGASIKAFCKLLSKKNYMFLGTNTAGNNAFFVHKKFKKKILKNIKEKKIFKSKFRESRNKSNKLTYLNKRDSLKLIKNKLVFDFESKRIKKIEELNI